MGVWRRWLTRGKLEALLVALLAFAVYANILPNGFVDDDEAQVLRNPWIRDSGHLKEIFSQSVWSFMRGTVVDNYYRPLMHVVYLLAFRLFGPEAWGFHLISALLHVVNSLLVYAIARRLTRPTATPGGWTLLAAPALAAGLLFAAHPAHTEAVAWIASVPELTFTLFSLVALLLYLPPAEARGGRLAGVATAFFVALLCKETGIVLPALLLVVDLAQRPGETWLRDRLPRYAALAVPLALYFALRISALWSTLVPARAWLGLSRYEQAINVLPLLKDYLALLILPVRLAFWREFEPISSLLRPDAILGLGIAALLVTAAVLAWRRHRQTVVALALLLIPLLPAFWIMALPRKVFAERYLYMPSVGFVLLLALALARCPIRWRRFVAAGVALILAGYVWGTVARNRVWADGVTLFTDTVRKAPDAMIPRYGLAVALTNQGRADEALSEFQLLVARFPDDAKSQSGLGAALLLRGRAEEAVERFRRAIELDPGAPETYNDLAMALRRLGRDEEAFALYRQAIAIDPGFPDAHFNLGNGLADLGERTAALTHYREAVRLRPDNAYYRARLGIELAEQGSLSEAVEQFEEAVRLAPEETAYRNNLERARRLLASPRVPVPPS